MEKDRRNLPRLLIGLNPPLAGAPPPRMTLSPLWENILLEFCNLVRQKLKVSVDRVATGF